MKSPFLTDLIHNYTSIIETISFEITSSDWPDTQSYINYRDHIWWNHQFWLTWYTIIHQLWRPYLVKSPVLTDLIHNHTSIIETISGEITSSDRPGTHYTYQNYTDHIWWNHQFWPTWYTIIHIRIIQNISGEITSSDWPDTQSYINYRDHIWWNHQFWPTWYTVLHYRDHIWWNHQFWLTWYTIIHQL